MARTPAAQGFGELGDEAGEWRGVLLEDGRAVVPPALVRAGYIWKKTKDKGAKKNVEYFLLTSISTHPDYPPDDRIRGVAEAGREGGKRRKQAEEKETGGGEREIASFKS